MNLKALIAMAAAQREVHPFSNAIAEATEVGVVVPSILRTKLEALGYTIDEKRGEHTTRVKVTKPADDGQEVLWACGTSDTFGDALLHAALGYVRERNIDLLMAQGMSKNEAVKRSIGPSVALT